MKFFWRTLILATLVGLLAARVRAQGGPPMLTDDTGTVEAGHWELNNAVTVDQRAGENVIEAPHLDMNYGLTERVHLKYEVGWLNDRAPGGPTRSAVGDSNAGVKWRFYDEGEKGWSLCTYPQFGFATPGSSATRRGLSAGGTSLFLPMEVQREFGGLELGADFGYQWSSRGGDSWSGGVIAGHAFGEKFEVMAELHATADRSATAYELTANFGARLNFSERYSLLVSAGRDLHDGLETKASLVAYVAWQVHLGKKS